MVEGFVICDKTSGVPSFYSLEVAKDFAAASGWTAEIEKALGFAREADAQIFMEKYLPHITPFATITSTQWEKK